MTYHDDGVPLVTEPLQEPRVLDGCQACGEPIEEGVVPDGYEYTHCRSCAEKIERRDWNRRGGVRYKGGDRAWNA